MCGIAGFLTKKHINPQESIAKIRRILRRRGPDSWGCYFDEPRSFHMLHTRLAIQDLSDAANQPMICSKSRYCIAFNGEIYNHRSLRKIISEETHFENWKTSGDTETLLELIAHFGLDRALSLIDGMFAFALYDIATGYVWLARDRYGEKPLYWTLDQNFAFASNLDALNEANPISKVISQEAKKQFFRQGFIAAPLSIYENVFKIPAGVYCQFRLTASGAHFVGETSWKFQNPADVSIMPMSVNKVKRTLIDSVSSRLTSDLPVGILLSGGIDSSLVAAICKNELGEDVDTFTVGFNEKDLNESVSAKVFSGKLGLKNTSIYVAENEAGNIIADYSEAYCEPFADPSAVPSLILAKYVSQTQTVVLTGDGADELFRGYNRYLSGYNLWKNSLLKYSDSNLNLGGLLSKLSNAFYYLSNHTNNFSTVLPFDKFSQHLHKLGSVADARDIEEYYMKLVGQSMGNQSTDGLNDQRFLQDSDIALYLPECVLTKMDRASMHYSLETRAPFLSYGIEVAAKSIDDEQLSSGNLGKVFLRNYLGELMPDSSFIFDAPKQGFTPSIKSLLRSSAYTELFEMAKSIRELNNVFEQLHTSGSRVFSDILKWRIVCFTAWYRRYL